METENPLPQRAQSSQRERISLLPSMRQPPVQPGFFRIGTYFPLGVLGDLCGKTFLPRARPTSYRAPTQGLLGRMRRTRAEERRRSGGLGGGQLHRSSFQQLPWFAETVFLNKAPNWWGAEHGGYPPPGPGENATAPLRLCARPPDGMGGSAVSPPRCIWVSRFSLRRPVVPADCRLGYRRRFLGPGWRTLP